MPIRAFRELNSELVGTSAPRSGNPVVVHLPTSIVDRTRATLARLDRGEIEPEDLERPHDERPRTTWASARDGRSGRDARAWDRDRDSGWDRDRGRDNDERWGSDRSTSEGRTARDAIAGRSRSRSYRSYDDETRYGLPLYARDARDARERRDGDTRDNEREADRPATRTRRIATSTVFYRAVEGDTAQSIGTTFGLPADDVCVQNGLKTCTAVDKGTLLRLRVPAKTLEKLGTVASHEG
jgi:hypothetical protein